MTPPRTTHVQGIIRIDSIPLLREIYTKFCGLNESDVDRQLFLSLLSDVTRRADQELTSVESAARDAGMKMTTEYFEEAPLRSIVDMVKPMLQVFGIAEHTATELGKQYRASYFDRVMALGRY